MAYASTKADRVSDFSRSDVMWKSSPILSKAGAIIDEDTGEMKVNADTINVAAHFFRYDQFLGLSPSSSESHVT